MNTELLFNLYAIHSPSGSEKKMRRFIRKYIASNCGDVRMDTDKYGNLLCVKGEAETYPCLASHIDQVQKSHSKDFEVVTNGEVCFGYSAKSREQQGLGADDKNGIFICLECLKAYDVLKVAFFVGEETGCVGSDDVDIEFFKDCRFIVEPDRRGGSDLITSMFCGGVCSDDFIKAIGAERFGYTEERGSITDVGTLVERGVGISCLNLSCGYYEAHTDNEFTVLSELENCLVFVMRIIDECTDVYPFEYEGRSYGRSIYPYGSLGYYGGKSLGSSFGTGRYGGNRQLNGFFEEVEDDYDAFYDYYCDNGYYDEDVCTMEGYLKVQPNLEFTDIVNLYVTDFHAYELFGMEDCRSILSDIYHEVKQTLYPELYKVS